jgi:hypothetical protein
MSSFAERARLRAAARAAAAPQRRGVRFIGNATGNTNVAKSPTRKASPHHKNRNVTRRAIRNVGRVSPDAKPPMAPGARSKFTKAAHKHAKKTEKRKKSRYSHPKGRKATRKHKKRGHKK